MACGDLGFERVEHMVARMVQRGLQALGGGEVDIGPDQVDQRQGADFIASGQHSGVDFAGGPALFQQRQRFAVKGARAAVDDEARAVRAGDDGFAGSFGHPTRQHERCGGGACMGDQFHQLHCRRRVEEV